MELFDSEFCVEGDAAPHRIYALDEHHPNGPPDRRFSVPEAPEKATHHYFIDTYPVPEAPQSR
eukprot:395694-Prymnesium_polylepis.2